MHVGSVYHVCEVWRQNKDRLWPTAIRIPKLTIVHVDPTGARIVSWSRVKCIIRDQHLSTRWIGYEKFYILALTE